MPEKLTLSAYLEQRGKKAKALKRGEAEAFGIPYPLQAGWPWRYGALEITPAMIEDAEVRIRAAKQEARNRAECRSAEVGKNSGAPQPPAVPALTAALFPGFVPRLARRYRARRSALRA